jgi:hypothetical protein
LAIARRNAEIKERRAIFAANANANADTPTNLRILDSCSFKISDRNSGKNSGIPVRILVRIPVFWPYDPNPINTEIQKNGRKSEE